MLHLCYRLIGIALINAMVIFRKATGSNISHAAYVRGVIRGLLTAQLPVLERHPGLPQDHQQATRLLPGNHFPEPHPPTARRTNSVKKCVVCCHVKRRESRYQCEACRVSLCVSPCFKLYHKCKDFKQAYNRLHRQEE